MSGSGQIAGGWGPATATATKLSSKELVAAASNSRRQVNSCDGMPNRRATWLTVRPGFADSATIACLAQGRGPQSEEDAYLKKHLRMVASMPIPDEVEAAWDKLTGAIRTDKDARVEHLAQVKAKKDAGRSYARS